MLLCDLHARLDYYALIVVGIVQGIVQGLVETWKLHKCLLVTLSSLEFTGPSPGLLSSIQYLRHSTTDARVNTDCDITITGQEHLCKVNHSSLCCVMLCYVMLCYVMLCYAMLCYVMLCYAMLCYAMLCLLCYVMLCYVMLCYVMLCYVCYVMLCYVNSFLIYLYW